MFLIYAPPPSQTGSLKAVREVLYAFTIYLYILIQVLGAQKFIFFSFSDFSMPFIITMPSFLTSIVYYVLFIYTIPITVNKV